MDKDIYSTLADSRPLIALIYKIYAKNTIYKKRQLYWFFIQSTSSEKWQDRNSRQYLIGINGGMENKCLGKTDVFTYVRVVKNHLM